MIHRYLWYALFAPGKIKKLARGEKRKKEREKGNSNEVRSSSTVKFLRGRKREGKERREKGKGTSLCAWSFFFFFPTAKSAGDVPRVSRKLDRTN